MQHTINFNFLDKTRDGQWLLVYCQVCGTSWMLRWFKDSCDYDLVREGLTVEDINYQCRFPRYIPTERQMNDAVVQVSAWTRAECSGKYVP